MKNKNDRKTISTKDLYLGELVTLDSNREPIIENNDNITRRFVIVRKFKKKDYYYGDINRYLDVFSKTIYNTVGDHENCKGDTIVYNLILIVTNMTYMSINDATRILLEKNPTIIEVDPQISSPSSVRTLKR